MQALELSRSYGALAWELRAAIDRIKTGRLTAMKGGVLSGIGELVASNDGIGFMILDMERAFRIPEMYAGIFTLMVVGYLLNRLFVVFESRTLAWYFGQSRRAQE